MDWALALLTLGVTGYIAWDYEWFLENAAYHAAADAGAGGMSSCW